MGNTDDGDKEKQIVKEEKTEKEDVYSKEWEQKELERWKKIYADEEKEKNEQK